MISNGHTIIKKCQKGTRPNIFDFIYNLFTFGFGLYEKPGSNILTFHFLV